MGENVNKTGIILDSGYLAVRESAQEIMIKIEASVSGFICVTGIIGGTAKKHYLNISKIERIID